MLKPYSVRKKFGIFFMPEKATIVGHINCRARNARKSSELPTCQYNQHNLSRAYTEVRMTIFYVNEAHN